MCVIVEFAVHPTATSTPSISTQESIPCLRFKDGRSVSGDVAIARHIVCSAGSSWVGLLGGLDSVEVSVADQWIDLSLTRDLSGLASTLDAHLAPRCG